MKSSLYRATVRALPEVTKCDSASHEIALKNSLRDGGRGLRCAPSKKKNRDESIDRKQQHGPAFSYVLDLLP